MVKRALAAEPKNPVYLDTLGWIYFRQGRYQQAVQILKKPGRTPRRNAELRDHLGDAYARVGRMHEARNLWQQALERDPDNARLRQKLGNRGG